MRFSIWGSTKIAHVQIIQAIVKTDGLPLTIGSHGLEH